MKKYRIVLILIICWNMCIAQDGLDAFKYKLDYNIPESPAFSVFDANPTTVMRGSAAQELVISVASNFISGNNVSPGLAIDFNPYFNLGGRLKSITKYRENYMSRLLANTTFSLATINSKEFQNDMLLSSGIRITLFDSKDPLFDVELGREIDQILLSALDDDEPGPPGFEDDEAEEIIDLPSLSEAYARSEDRYRKMAGGSLSLGAAIATRVKNRTLHSENLSTFRSQVWLSGQYDFGETKMSLNGMIMYRNDHSLETRRDGLLAGLALRHYGEKVILVCELTYSSVISGFEYSGYAEFYLIPQITLTVSLAYRLDDFTEQDGLLFKPGVKWNMSELGAK